MDWTVPGQQWVDANCRVRSQPERADGMPDFGTLAVIYPAVWYGGELVAIFR
jgi:hypothetical protein